MQQGRDGHPHAHGTAQQGMGGQPHAHPHKGQTAADVSAQPLSCPQQLQVPQFPRLSHGRVFSRDCSDRPCGHPGDYLPAADLTPGLLAERQATSSTHTSHRDQSAARALVQCVFLGAAWQTHAVLLLCWRKQALAQTCSGVFRRRHASSRSPAHADPLRAALSRVTAHQLSRSARIRIGPSRGSSSARQSSTVCGARFLICTAG
jgi:hypothetical protein